MNLPLLITFLLLLTFAGCSTYLIIERETHTYIERGVRNDRERKNRADDGDTSAADEDDPGTGTGDGQEDSGAAGDI